jgi:hypothetical protein
MILTLDAKRRLTVPASLAPASPGDVFEARFDAEENEIVFGRIAGVGDWLAVLSECPVSMDDLPRRRRKPARRRRSTRVVGTPTNKLPPQLVTRA